MDRSVLAGPAWLLERLFDQIKKGLFSAVTIYEENAAEGWKI